MALFYKPKDISYQYMQGFVDKWKLGDDKAKLYKYLYLLIKNHAKERKMFSSAYETEVYAEEASKLAYNDILSGKHPDYFSYRVNVESKKEVTKREKIPQKQESFTDKYHAFKFDVNSSGQIKRILSKIPRKKDSCESINIELSVLLSIINLMYGNNDVILFHTDSVYVEYVRCIANLIYRSVEEISV